MLILGMLIHQVEISELVMAIKLKSIFCSVPYTEGIKLKYYDN